MSLAFISLFTDLPIRTVNCIALGALFISVSELIISISTKLKSKKTRICVEDLETVENKLDAASMYLEKSLDESITISLPSRRVLLPVCLLDSCAIATIIALPHNKGFSFLEMNKLGTFCTIASLGIIMLSRYVAEIKETLADLDNRKNYIEGVVFYMGTIRKSIEENTEKLSKLAESNRKVAQSYSKEEQKKRGKRNNKLTV